MPVGQCAEIAGLSPFGAHTLGRLFQRFHVNGLSSASKRSSRIATTLLEFFFEARGTSGPLAALGQSAWQSH